MRSSVGGSSGSSAEVPSAADDDRVTLARAAVRSSDAAAEGLPG